MDNATGVTQETWNTTDEYGDESRFMPNQQFKTAAYCIIGLCGLVGNLFACIVFWTLQSNRNRVSLLIFTQALADLATSVLLILFGITQIWRHRRPTSVWLCRFWWTQFALFFFTAISTFNLTLISLERYTAVVHPLAYTRCFTRRNAKIFVVLVWLIAPVMQYMHPAFWLTAASKSCQEVAPLERLVQAVIGVLLYLWELVIPVCIMGVCYFSIMKTIRRQEKACRSPFSPANKNVLNRDITMTLLIMFVLFVVCWTPNQTTFVQFNLGGPLDYEGGWYHFTVILAFLNSCVNPFVYVFRLRQFRVRILLMMRCRWAEAMDPRRVKARHSPRARRTSQQVVQSVA